MRDAVVDSIAFFLHAASVVGADQERILEEAITTNVQTQHDSVIDTVDVTVETESRERALESAKRKASYEEFSNAELRALVESDSRDLQQIAHQGRPSHQDLIDHVLNEPSFVEEGLKITAMQAPIEYHDLAIHVDLVGEDANEQLVLIEVIESASQEQIEWKVEQLETLLSEGDLEERQPARGLVVVDADTDDFDPIHTLAEDTSRVEVRQIE